MTVLPDVPETPSPALVRLIPLTPGMMRVRLMSHYPDVVVCILHYLELDEFVDNNLEVPLIAHNPIFLTFPDDTRYREISGWCSDALACGLVHSVAIRR